MSLEYATREELLACLDHLLKTAGNSQLMTNELKSTLCDHALGNYRVLITMGNELLSAAVQRELPRLDETLFLDVFALEKPPRKPSNAKSRKRGSGMGRR